ncbi:MAG: hypothetical protein KGS61_10825 [Verrucomicrobia bacterium]|nr:hypothetical protein [Verrucomicrobiota bacterium]
MTANAWASRQISKSSNRQWGRIRAKGWAQRAGRNGPSGKGGERRARRKGQRAESKAQRATVKAEIQKAAKGNLKVESRKLKLFLLSDFAISGFAFCLIDHRGENRDQLG